MTETKVIEMPEGKITEGEEIHIVNGKRFRSFEEVERYCEKNNYRITNTQTVKRRTFLITVVSNDHAKMVKS